MAIPVAIALPFFYEKYGEKHPNGGGSAMAIMMNIVLLGACATAIFLVLGSILQYCLRYRSWKLTLLIDAALAVLICAYLAHAGSTARVVDIQSGSPTTSMTTTGSFREIIFRDHQ
jgi:hypothetical protein